ncbi:hypothetical protein H8356DRAFT_930526 [Neocallimastix lanati (nom. inval.)]|jgi:hypothetical protein|uniref:Uncharacterized protein n=1 Tax=Neocallimastix californiae TaxID=1754190 RepID=A0A1Y2AF56_9FUNG|nr:hypothetical protein H8356DRAFT_930526 [Neocallimastix sp. JGI-2020a]ORY21116.1 hypothetical protein LY90DRAFT_516275 [Neocallimastix californiae]|eukprot:ORY21116.1 hypothetical protein LY90DRAFT_516275 [Neocallimastix californiae]
MKVNFLNIHTVGIYPIKSRIACKSVLHHRAADVVSFSSKKISIAEFNKRLNNMGVNTKTCTTEQVFDCFGTKYEKDDNGKLILYKYAQPATSMTYSDYGIKEDDLLNDIVEIKGDAFFVNSDAESLGALKYIEGNAYFQKSKLKDFEGT